MTSLLLSDTHILCFSLTEAQVSNVADAAVKVKHSRGAQN